MPVSIIILNADQGECEALRSLLGKREYDTISTHSFEDLELLLEKVDYQALILDLDTVSLDNRSIRRISNLNPKKPILCTSADRIHPELEEAIGNYIYACISKPVDPEEILYLLKCALENDITPSKDGNNQFNQLDHK
jgi:DNA-binding NtrC family response regulator